MIFSLNEQLEDISSITFDLNKLKYSIENTNDTIIDFLDKELYVGKNFDFSKITSIEEYDIILSIITFLNSSLNTTDRSTIVVPDELKTYIDHLESCHSKSNVNSELSTIKERSYPNSTDTGTSLIFL